MTSVPARRTWRRLVRARRRGTLSLAGLDAGARTVARMALAAMTLATLFLGLNLVLEWWPGPVVRVPGQLLGEAEPGRLSGVAFTIAAVAVAAALAAFGMSFAAARGRRRRVGLVLLGLVGIEIGVALLGVGRQVAIVFPAAEAVPRGAGLLAIVAGIVLALLPARIVERRRLLAASLAAAPVLLALAVVVVLAGYRGDVPAGVDDPRWPATIHGTALAAGSLANLIDLAAGLVGVLFVWQSVVAARALRREAGVAAGSLTDRHPLVLPALLGGKLAFLAAGYAGLLPPLLEGTARDAWIAARSEDPLGLAVGVGIAIAVGAWLLRGARPSVPDGGIGPAAAFVVVGFSLAAMLASSALLVLALSQTTSEIPAAFAAVPAEPSLLDCAAAAASGVGAASLCLTRAFTGLIWIGPIATWIAAGVLAAILWRQRRRRPLALALGAIALWMTPVAVAVIRLTVTGTEVAAVGRVELINLDALLTAVVAVLGILWWAGRQRAVGPGALALVLVTSTLVAHAGALVPVGRDGLVIGLVIVIGGLYALLFESGPLNEATDERSELVSRALGLQVLGLALVVFSIAFDRYDGGGADIAGLLLPPVVALLVAAELSRGHRARARTKVAAPPPSRGLAAAAAGLVVVGLVVGIANIARLPAPGAPAAARYAAFIEHADAGRLALLTTIATASQVQDEASFVAFLEAVEAEAAWTLQHDAADCYRDEFGRWARFVASFVALRDELVGAGEGAMAAFDEAMVAERSLAVGSSACQTVVPGGAVPSPQP